MIWPELEEVSPTATSFRLVLERDGQFRECVDPGLWKLTALTSLELSGVGLRRLDHQRESSLPDEIAEEPAADPEGAVARTGASDAASQGGLCCLARLRDLALGANSLGPVLQPEGALHGLSALRSLDLQGNGLEVLPAALVSLTALTSLNIGRNNLTELPWLSLSLLPELRSIAAPQNQIVSAGAADGADGQGGDEVAGALPPRLTELTLRANALEGEGGLAVLASSGTLAMLDVAENRLSSLPSELALGCQKLSRLDIGGNAWADKKLAKLAEAQTDQAPAKPILEFLRKGQSKRQLKSQMSLRSSQRPAPPRLYLSGSPQRMPAAEEAAEEPLAPAPGKKSNKKGKNKANASAGYPVGTGAAAVAAIPPRKFVTVSRDVLSVRPHILAAVLHVVAVAEQRDAEDDARKPFVFHAEGGDDPTPKDFENAFEANLGLLDIGQEIDEATAQGAARAALTAVKRLRSFIDVQTRIHAASDLGDKRRAGALGAHNAEAIEWPLRFAAAPHSAVRFQPLAIGWMQEKGVVTAEEFAREAAAGRVAGAPKDVSLALQRPAIALRSLPLCPHMTDAKGTVLSVHPLSNGWPSRNTPDARGGVVLECSSSKDEKTCRRMLLALICDAIELIEGRSDSSTADVARLQQKCVRVLVEPVDTVCEWDHKLRRAEFPTYDELLTLPPLPEYCEAPRSSNACVLNDSGSGRDD